MQRIAILSVHTSPVAPPGGKKVGGMNTYVREIAQEFAARGITIDIFTRRTSDDTPYIDTSLGNGVNVITVKAGETGPLSTTEIVPHLQQFTARVIAYTIRQNVSYDLIFSHYWLSGWVAQKLKEAWGTPFVQMFHTLGHMKNRIPSVTSPVPEQRIRVETQVIEWADAIIANTRAEQSQLLWLYRADRRKITVCPPGVNTNRFYPLPQSTAREQLNIPPDDNLLLFVGRIEPLKAVDSIIEALAILRQNHPDLLQKTRFAVIGGNPSDKTDMDMRALQQLTDELGLNQVVSFLGAKGQSKLTQWYAAATAVIMPSEYESFGMVALEAMATGTPVIASEVGGLAYLVKDNETGYLVPSRAPSSLADRIVDVLDNPTERQQMATHAAALAKTYAWEVIAGRLLMIFEEILRRERPAMVS